jgi:hypothetical protein
MSQKRLSKINEFVEKELDNQDHMQRISLVSSVSLELYRVLVSSLLILFVPQNCDGHICTLNDNLSSDNTRYSVGVVFNFITLFTFILLYGIEISRENKLIKYLEVNPHNPRDNESLATIFSKIPHTYKNKIYRLDFYYQKISYICLLFFIINTGLSARIVYDYSLGNQTTTTFITNVLFMALKVYDTYTIANTDKSIFYSAYLRDKVQFNDIDPSILAILDKEENIDTQEDNRDISENKEIVNKSYGIEVSNIRLESEKESDYEFEEIGDLHELSIKLPSSEILYKMFSRTETEVLDIYKNTRNINV